MITGWPATPLQFDSAVPYYAQLKEVLRTQIRELPPHSALPSEQDLQTAFQVSRTVVRQALLELVHDGAVYRRKGKGSFIAPAKVAEGQVQRLTSFSSEMARQGYHPATEVLDQRIAAADDDVAARLSVAVGSDVVLLKRLRRLEGEPLMTSTTWLAADLCSGLETADVSNRSLYELLSAEHHHTIVRGTRTLEAVLADRALAALLETRKGNPLVRLEIVSYVASGRALEYSVAYHRGDRARFEFDVANTQSAPEEMA